MARTRQGRKVSRRDSKGSKSSRMDTSSQSMGAAGELPAGDRRAGADVGCFLDEETLYCEICLDIMHNAMSVAPCNHKFCAGCIFEWHDRNPYCPKCRWWVADITRDAFANVIIEKFLDAYPEKRRSTSTLNLLDDNELKHLEKYQERRDVYDEDEYVDHLLGPMEDESFSSDSDESDSEGEEEETEEDEENDEMDEEEMEDEGDDGWGETDSQTEAEEREMAARRAMENNRIEFLRKAKEEREQQARRAERERTQAERERNRAERAHAVNNNAAAAANGVRRRARGNNNNGGHGERMAAGQDRAAVGRYATRNRTQSAPDGPVVEEEPPRRSRRVRVAV